MKKLINSLKQKRIELSATEKIESKRRLIHNDMKINTPIRIRTLSTQAKKQQTRCKRIYTSHFRVPTIGDNMYFNLHIKVFQTVHIEVETE